MPNNPTSAQMRGSIGGLVRAALAPSRPEITRQARAALWQKYIDQVREARPELTDEADIIRRAEMLRNADMKRLALKASAARSRAKRAREAAAKVAAEVAREQAELTRVRPA